MFKNLNLNSAQLLINHYEQIEQQNLGVGYYIFQLLWQKNIIPNEDYYQTFDKFLNIIEINKEIFAKTDFIALLNDYQDFTNFVYSACEQGITEQTDKKIFSDNLLNKKIVNPIRLNLIDYLSREGVYKETGSAYALFFAAKIEDGNYHALSTAIKEGRVKYGKDGRVHVNIYRRDPNFEHWSINQIGKFNIYASCGPSVRDIKKDVPLGFFYEILISGSKKNASNITTIVAIGEPGKDFVDYFTKPFGFRCIIDEVDSEFSATKLEEPENHGEYSIYKIKLHLTQTYLEKHKKSKNRLVACEREQAITVISIAIPDGTAFKIAKENLTEFNDIFQLKLKNKEDIVVHCHAGLGRTGQCIVQMLLGDEELFNSVFAIDNVQETTRRIGKMVEHLRKSRPGLILTPPQLMQAVKSAQEVHLAKYPVKQEDNIIIESNQHNDRDSNKFMTKNWGNNTGSSSSNTWAGFHNKSPSWKIPAPITRDLSVSDQNVCNNFN